ncbi:transposase [Streptomyces malaysiensis]|uniref:transposase n=1 Tax=Streptomyces malaysiensis TaxID=92644 RepID=UPI001AD90921|nr:transposase [Streptomyces malaysiensis]
MNARRPYRSDVSDARWALIEPVFTDWRAKRTGPGTAARVHELREIVNAVLYVNRTGIPWEYLPPDFPPYKTYEQSGRQSHDQQLLLEPVNLGDSSRRAP